MNNKKGTVVPIFVAVDDGYCPFKDGKYEVSYTEGVVNLSWSFDGSEIYTKNQSFILPDSSLDSE